MLELEHIFSDLRGIMIFTIQIEVHGSPKFFNLLHICCIHLSSLVHVEHKIEEIIGETKTIVNFILKLILNSFDSFKVFVQTWKKASIHTRRRSYLI